MVKPMTVKLLRQEVQKKLAQSHVSNADLEANWLLESMMNMSEVEWIKNPDSTIDPGIVDKVQSAVHRRISGEPLAYILGEKEFYGLKFQVSKEVLIPRPETEGIVDRVLNWLNEKQLQNSKLKILDLGTGSGCILLTLLKHLEHASGFGLDQSSGSLAIAKKNAEMHVLNHRVTFICDDATKCMNYGNEFDVVVANPPYIDPDDDSVDENVKIHEPHLALFSRPGIAALVSWTSSAAKALRPGGLFVCEIGFNQGEKTLEFASDSQLFLNQRIEKDYSNHDRYLIAERR